MVTEKRLIDKEKVYQRACAGCTRHGETPGECYHDEPCERLIFAFTTAEPVDAVEVVHGRWEFSHTTTVEKFAIVKCSNCGHEAFAIANYVKEGHYCPNCGAKMDGERREGNG